MNRQSAKAAKKGWRTKKTLAALASWRFFLCLSGSPRVLASGEWRRKSATLAARCACSWCRPTEKSSRRRWSPLAFSRSRRRCATRTTSGCSIFASKTTPTRPLRLPSPLSIPRSLASGSATCTPMPTTAWSDSSPNMPRSYDACARRPMSPSCSGAPRTRCNPRVSCYASVPRTAWWARGSARSARSSTASLAEKIRHASRAPKRRLRRSPHAPSCELRTLFR